MSLVERCWQCQALRPLCRCSANPTHLYPDDEPTLIDTDNPPELRPENKEGWKHGDD